MDELCTSGAKTIEHTKKMLKKSQWNSREAGGLMHLLKLTVLDLVSQIRDVVLMNVYIFGSGKPRGVGILE